MAYLVEEKLWKTKEGKIVRDGDPRSAFLFATPGMTLTEKPVIEVEPGKKSTNQKDKKALKPDEDKALKPDEDKGEKENDEPLAQNSDEQPPDEGK